MSFIYSQALVAAFSEANCSAIDASAPLSGNPTPNPSLWHDKTMEVSRHSRYGMTCKPLMDGLGAELLTSWLAGFPVKTYPQPEKAQELTESAAECGRTWRGWLAKYDPSSSSWKTAQCSFIEDLGESLATFPRSGMTRGGLLWELPMLERPTKGTGFGFSPRWLFPTPTCNPEAPNHGSNSKGPHNLKEVAMLGWSPGMMWPTPTVCGNYNRKGASATSGDGLATAVRTWLTPTAQDSKNNGAPSQMVRNTKPLNAEVGGPLNPSWVEWLMGWPIGWTGLKPSGMDKSQPVPQPLGESLEGLEA